MDEPEVLQCETTAGSQDEARAIADALVRRRLAACCQVVGPIESTYRWQGEIERSQEWLVLVKTTAPLADAVKAAIAQLHSYDEPEVLAFAAVDGSPGYLSWVRSEAGAPGPDSP